MQPALVVRFRPAGPWRIGPDSGARDTVEFVYHSDSLFSAMTQAFARLGEMEAWLEATARSAGGPALALSSCFPYLDEVHFVAPPRTLWPPPPSPRVRWEAARFVPLSLVSDLLAGKAPEEEAWRLDGPSQCLMPAGIPFSAPGPFRPNRRSRAAVDRLSGHVLAHSTACLEFAEGGGMWAVVGFADEQAWVRWSDRVRGALRWLADTGLGGERSLGWGRSAPPEFIEAELPGTILAAPGADQEAGGPGSYWLLSLFVPSEGDSVDWQRSRYTLLTRGGRLESSQGWGASKKWLRMVSEGSVLWAAAPPRGTARDVASEGFPHPAYRSGLALAVRIPAPPVAERSPGGV